MDLNITRTNPDQEWKQHLVLVSTNATTRLVGVVKDTDCFHGKPFILYRAAQYFTQVQCSPHPQNPRAVVYALLPRLIVPYSIGETVIPELHVITYDHIVEIRQLHPKDRDWFYESYLTCLDGPSSLVSAQLNPDEASRHLRKV